MQTRSDPIVSICILTYNRSTILRKLLTDLDHLGSRNIERIVVDNNSSDDTCDVVRTNFVNVRYIRTTKNIGAAARNLGLKAARGEIVVCLDDDVFGISDVELKVLVNLFKKREKLGAVNFRILDHETYNICNWVHHRDPDLWCDKEFLTYEITEGAVAFRKSALRESGFYPDYFFLSHEGPDLALRLIDRGYEVIYSPAVTVIHCHSCLGRQSWLNYYYDTRNQFWLAVRNFPLSYAICYLMRGLLSMAFYSMRDGYFTYFLRAVWDALRKLKRPLKERVVLSENAMLIIREIDKKRPGIGYYFRNRILRDSVRL